MSKSLHTIYCISFLHILSTIKVRIEMKVRFRQVRQHVKHILMSIAFVR